jgi:hypothetical protein
MSPGYILHLGSLGFVRTKTLKAFPEPAYREIIARLNRVGVTHGPARPRRNHERRYLRNGEAGGVRKLTSTQL